METLLEKIGIINYKYTSLNDSNSFNIFEILRHKSDEVNLHSRFLVELLDKNGKHHLGDRFLQLFLPIVKVKNFDFNDYQVIKEYKNIDILIRNNSQAIIIENKIWAGDQPKQLERYYNTIKNENFTDIWIFYLTLRGYAPSEKSIGNLKEPVEQISYSLHIDKWIEKCIDTSSKYPRLRETLIQYQKLINDLTGNSTIMEQRLEIIKLLSENDNIFKAQMIAENWIHVRWHTEYDFWLDFEKVVANEYKILDSQKFSADTLNSVIHQSRNRNPWYGLKFEIGKLENYSLCVFIERGFGELYYGLFVQNEDCNSAGNNSKLDKIATKMEAFCDWKKTNCWLGGKWLTPKIDFENFSNKETLKLVKPDFRKEYIQENWKIIKGFIENCKNTLTVVN